MSNRINRSARWIAAFTIAVSLATAANVATSEPLELRFDARTTLEIVARRMGVALRSDVPLPTVRFESTTPLRRLQDAVEAQWGTRPERFVNVYVVATNEIFLIDDPAGYIARKATLDELLAHELAHYLQARYTRADLSGEWHEMEAINIQNWFRAEHGQPKLVEAD